MSLKEFSPKKNSEFHLKSYGGRLKHFQKLINPKYLLFSNQQILGFLEILNHPENQKIKSTYTNAELWTMKYVVDSNLHPQTHKPIPKLFRISSFLPVNIPISIALAFLPATTINQLFGQTLNSTYNFVYNLENGNKTNQYNQTQLAIALFGSILVGCAASIGLTQQVKRLKIQPFMKMFLGDWFAPYFGLSLSSIFTLGLSRYKDFNNGIMIADSKTKELITEFKSKNAARKAFIQTAVTKVTLPIPIMFLPKFITHIMKKGGIFPKSQIGVQAFNIGLSAFLLYVGLSGAVAIFPQNAIIHRSKLEEEFQNLCNSKGDKIEYFMYNRGL